MKVVANYKPLGQISLLRRVMALLPGTCRYCGRWRLRFQDVGNLGLVSDGRVCPDAHEGYIVKFYGFGFVKMWFDYIIHPPADASATLPSCEGSYKDSIDAED